MKEHLTEGVAGGGARGGIDGRLRAHNGITRITLGIHQISVKHFFEIRSHATTFLKVHLCSVCVQTMELTELLHLIKKREGSGTSGRGVAPVEGEWHQWKGNGTSGRGVAPVEGEWHQWKGSGTSGGGVALVEGE